MFRTCCLQKMGFRGYEYLLKKLEMDLRKCSTCDKNSKSTKKTRNDKNLHVSQNSPTLEKFELRDRRSARWYCVELGHPLVTQISVDSTSYRREPNACRHTSTEQGRHYTCPGFGGPVIGVIVTVTLSNPASAAMRSPSALVKRKLGMWMSRPRTSGVDPCSPVITCTRSSELMTSRPMPPAFWMVLVFCTNVQWPRFAMTFFHSIALSLQHPN